ncbi:MAG: aminopeptidase P family protein [Actinomycetota bacterium]
MDHPLRRRRLSEALAALDLDALYVTRGTNARYLSGFTGSNARLVARRDGGHLLTDGRYEEQAAREAPDLPRAIYRSGEPPVFGAPTAGVRRLGFESAHLTYDGWVRLGRGAEDAGIELVPTDGVVEALRRVKEPAEIDRIRVAQEATDVAFEAVVLGGGLVEGMTERDLAWALERAMRDAGADGLAFDVIAAFGEQAAEPHHAPSDRTLRRGDVVKTDFGALVDGYHADMTRTVAFGEPDPRLREIRDLVAASQAAGIAAVRPGATLGDVDRASRSVIEDAGLGERFPHGLGHGVGLDIHEDPFLRPARDEVLLAGTVVTIEPGVYIPGLGGIRIEDMVEVTADGGREIPRSSKEFLLP